MANGMTRYKPDFDDYMTGKVQRESQYPAPALGELQHMELVMPGHGTVIEEFPQGWENWTPWRRRQWLYQQEGIMDPRQKYADPEEKERAQEVASEKRKEQKELVRRKYGYDIKRKGAKKTKETGTQEVEDNQLRLYYQLAMEEPERLTLFGYNPSEIKAQYKQRFG